MKTNIYAPVIVSVDNISIDATKRYGIKHSTTLDQTTAMQNLADDMAGNSGARHVLLPHGEIHIDGTVNFQAAKEWAQYPSTADSTSGVAGLHITGQGIGATHFVQEGVGVPTFAVSEAGAGRQHNYLRMGSFSMEGPGLANSGSIGIQLGGISTDASDIIAGAELSYINIRNFSTAYAFDDCTNLNLHKIQMEGYNYGIEHGFNIDVVSALQCRFGSPSVPQGLGCTITSGSNVITGFADTSNVTVGMRPASASIPWGTSVTAVSATTVTLDANATANASSVDFVIGTSISFGAGSFVGNWPSAGTSGANAHKYSGCSWARNYECLNIAESNISNITLENGYAEKCTRIATLSNASSVGPKYVIFDAMHIAQPQILQDAAIYEDLTSSGSGTTIVRNCRTDVTGSVPWVRLDSGNSRLEWDNNQLPVSTGDTINVFDSSNGFTPTNQSKFFIGVTGVNVDLLSQGTAGSITPRPTPRANCTIKLGAITADISIAAAHTGLKNAMVDGQTVRFSILQDSTGGWNVTWDASYKFNTAWSNTGNTANTQSFVDFYYDGANFIQTSPANTWI